MSNRAIAIDPPWSRDKDDAIDIEFLGKDGWGVKVYVPDVASILKDFPQLMGEAYDQGVTLYSSNSIKKPMLGEDLTRDLSLSSSRISPMLEIEMAVSSDLEVDVIGITPVRERIFAEISYETADRAMKDGRHPLNKRINLLWTLGSLLQKKRCQATDAVFDLQEGIYTNEEGKLVTLGQGMAHRSTIIVMELMIMTNAALARYSLENNRPMLFRNHMLSGMDRGGRKHSSRIIAANHNVSLEEARNILKSLSHEIQPAVLETESKGHHGLDLDAYGWFTSPLRRFCDVINLSSLAYGYVWPDLDEAANRLSRIHQTAKDSSSEHHGKISRKRLIGMVLRGQHSDAMTYDLHTLLNAMEENEVALNPLFHDHVRQRLARDDLSTRDLRDLVEKSQNLFGSDFSEEIEAWINKSEARQVILKGMDEEIKVKNHNYKGLLLERAAKLKTEVTFKLQNQSGPSHEPVFTSLATWKSDSGEITTIGVGRSLKDAEKKAAYQLLEQLGPLSEDATKPQTVVTANPKSALLEYAARQKDRVEFGAAIKTGPDHKPSFEIEVIYHAKNSKNSATGQGSNKKEAEVDACRKILEQLIP